MHSTHELLDISTDHVVVAHLYVRIGGQYRDLQALKVISSKDSIRRNKIKLAMKKLVHK